MAEVGKKNKVADAWVDKEKETMKKESIVSKAEEKKEENDDRNFKEKLYDKIPVSLKTLDILIAILITVFVLMMLYFILRKFS